MTRKHISVQIYTGSADSPVAGFEPKSIISKLSKIYEKLQLACVMIGWDPGADIGGIIDYVKQRGTDVYLWLPVFSGWDGMKPLIGERGGEIEQHYRTDSGERFDFGCPAHPENVKSTILRFETLYRKHAYDGVFLDKIRFPGFMFGAHPIFSCFCDYCRQLHGISGGFEARGGENPLHLTAYDGTRYILGDETISRLFKYKADAVSASIAGLTGYFRESGYKIGLDLLSPFLAFFVGQDYRKLLPLADFVKPMFYRITNAPAGIPFELDMYASAFGGGQQVADRRKSYLLDLLGTSEIGVEFVNREIKSIRSCDSCNAASTSNTASAFSATNAVTASAASTVSTVSAATVANNASAANTATTANAANATNSALIYAGVEINRIKNIAPVTAQYINENLTRIDNVDGFTLSWDLNTAQPADIDAALDCLS